MGPFSRFPGSLRTVGRTATYTHTPILTQGFPFSVRNGLHEAMHTSYYNLYDSIFMT